MNHLFVREALLHFRIYPVNPKKLSDTNEFEQSICLSTSNKSKPDDRKAEIKRFYRLNKIVATSTAGRGKFY